MTTPEVPNFSQPEDREPPRKDTGYDIPYNPDDMTDDQARELASQKLGGPDAARQAKRADQTEFFDKDIGFPEGTQDVVKAPPESLAAVERWSSRNEKEIEGIQARLDVALSQNDREVAARSRADMEKHLQTRQELAERAERLKKEIGE